MIFRNVYFTVNGNVMSCKSTDVINNNNDDSVPLGVLVSL